jgi:hypothetical protein
MAAGGVSQREIARPGGIYRRTVGRMLASVGPPHYRRTPPGLKLDPFDLVLRWVLEEWPGIKALRMTEGLLDYGCEGSVDVVKRRLRELRPPTERPGQRTGYRPGQVLQFEWAELPTRPGAMTCVLVRVWNCSTASSSSRSRRPKESTKGSCHGEPGSM